MTFKIIPLKSIGALAVPVYIISQYYHYNIVICVSFGSRIKGELLNSPISITACGKGPRNSRNSAILENLSLNFKRSRDSKEKGKRQDSRVHGNRFLIIYVVVIIL